MPGTNFSSNPAVLTAFEEKTWKFCFDSHLNRGYSPRRAHELTWQALTDIFPRLREFDGISLSMPSAWPSDRDRDDGQILGLTALPTGEWHL
jgi:hypothetical protein